MSSSKLRSSPQNWLIGKSNGRLSTARLPRGLDVLRLVHFHHLDKKERLPTSFKKACEAVISVWNLARIPSKRIDACVRKLSTLYQKYFLLKKSRNRKLESDRVRENMFKNYLGKLFDISTRNVLLEVKNEEDREFFRKQRNDVFSSSMAGVDQKTSAKEKRRKKRQEKETVAKRKYEEREKKYKHDTVDQPSSTSHCTSESEEEYKSCASSSAISTTGSSASRKLKNIFKSPEVVGALDRVNLPDRGAVFVAGAVAKALGHDISDITLSRSSIRRSRRQGRHEAAKGEVQSTTLDGPLVLHWDSKLLPDIQGSAERNDRIAVLVTQNDEEKLLGIPKMETGTGESQALACLHTIQSWNISSQIKALVFDTTAVNTGLHKGACKRIEEALETELVWIPCRHHVMEIILSSVFASIFGSSVSPQNSLFERFKKNWVLIRKEPYQPAPEKLFRTVPFQKLRREMLVYLPRAIQDQHPRDDYKEFLQLSLLFLGGGSGNETFRFPGPTHHARWMAKGIYIIKIFLFREHFAMSSTEEKQVTNMALFLSLVYIKYWNEAPLGVRAPNNDLKLLSLLESYPDRNVAESATKALRRHLWFFSEHLVALAFFDDRVSSRTKKMMVGNLQRPKLDGTPRRLNVGNTSTSKKLKLEDMVSERTASFFDTLIKEGENKSQSFLKIRNPLQWKKDPVFQDLLGRARKMKVVNDAAERAISLIQKYNQTLTHDEEQKQFILRLVSEHRKNIPKPKKSFFV